MHLKVFSTIGGVDLIVQYSNGVFTDEYAKLRVMTKDCAAVAYATALTAYQQDKISPELWDVAHVIASEPRPKPPYVVGVAETPQSE